jgi:hypothetical protein
MSRTNWLTTAAIVLLCLAAAPLLRAADSKHAQKIDAILRSAGLKSSDIPGAAVLVVNEWRNRF